MDENRPRERIISILNEEHSSFTIRRNEKGSVAAFRKRSELAERPNLLRQTQYSRRTSSFSSAGTPPLLRFDSSSSASSSSSSHSMESSPSPIAPAFIYNDGMLPYSDLASYLPSPTGITPLVEQQMMISQPAMQYNQKIMPNLAPAQYPVTQIPQTESQPSSVEPINPSLPSDHSTNSNASPSATSVTNPPAVKKNKYPCPYASTHNCLATFTTSGHAARHGKKHTGEKGVHCPVCNKAFTRKDNMKQHERTHKNGGSSSIAESEVSTKRSKAAITKDAAAQKAKASKKSTTDSRHSRSIQHSRQLSNASQALMQSPLSSVTASLSIPDSMAEQPLTNLAPLDPSFVTSPTSALLDPSLLQVPVPVQSLYPPLSDESLLQLQKDTQLQAQAMMQQQMPPLVRGFSDLDTLAAVAVEGFDPSFYGAMQ